MALLYAAEGGADATDSAIIAGPARVIDGDTLSVNGRRIRLFGIDAPERAQRCRSADGIPYECGQTAARALSTLVDNREVRCEPRDTDIYGRTVAVCWVADEDVNRALVRAGLAVAYSRYSLTYVPDEVRARWARRGLWAGTFEMPWEYRRNGQSARSRG